MTIVQKLQIIKRLSGFTQEKLAKELRVSFATLNSWINNKSTPHQAKQLRINDLFLQYTGLTATPDIPSQDISKKDIINVQAKNYPNILQTILNRPDLLEQFILSLTYHTNRLEGSSLTEDQTAAVIFRNETINNKNLIEHLEAKNHQTALKFLFNHLLTSKIDEKLILKLHQILMNGIRDDAGFYRRQGVRIVGSNVPTANYLKIPDLMPELIVKINSPQADIIQHVTLIHSQFEQIHPFSDGNGRLGRLILSAMLLLANLPPAVIKIKEKKFYLNYLRRSQLYQDYTKLEDFICDAILNGFKIIQN